MNDPKDRALERLANQEDQYSRSCGWTGNPADAVEAEFMEVFGRPPDAYDRRLGLARVIEFQKSLRQLLG